MKIQKITPILVDRFLLVRVYTDQGLVGNGEAGLWAHHGMVHRAILDLSEYYIGKDPSRIEHHYQTVSRDTHFMGAALSAALSAIDIALWDIAGQAVGQPVHQLLGGRVRDRIKVYGNVHGTTVDECAASAQEQVGAGYLSLRMTPFLPGFERKTPSHVIGDAIAMVAAVRQPSATISTSASRSIATCAPRRQSSSLANYCPSASSTTKTRSPPRVWRPWSTSPRPFLCR